MIYSPNQNQIKVVSKEVFSNALFGELTVILTKDEKPYFIGKQVTEALGYTDKTQAIRKHCKGGVEMTLPSPGGMQRTKIIPESDVYRLIMRSNKEEAEKFQDWVMEDVLPSIRKRGIYATDNVVDKFLNDPDFAIKLLTEYKEEKQKRKEEEERRAIAEEKVKLLTHVEKMYTATEVAKECGLSSAIALNTFLAEQKIQFKVNDTWVPYSQYSDKGYFHMKQEVLDTGKVIYHRKITQIGREFIVELINEKASN
jgi:prophage antirepressor-like protein